MTIETKLSTTSIFIRSFIFAIFLPLFTIPWSVVCLCSLPFPLKKRYYIVMIWTRTMVWMLKHLCHIDYVIEGSENIPKDRNGIIFSKHQSAWETFLIPSLFNETAIILKRELFWVPFFGWGLMAISPIAINRRESSSAMEQVIKNGKQCLQEGRWILIFPEGTRIAPGKIGKYRLGGARLAVATGYPILPIAHNAGKFWPKRGFIKHPGTIRLVIGPLIETKDQAPEKILEKAKSWIEKEMQRIG